MLTLLTKGLRSSKPTNLPSRLRLPCRPPFVSEITALVRRFNSRSGGEQPDKEVLRKLKKIAALRREFERREGFQMLNHGFRHVMEMKKRGVPYETVKANRRKVGQLHRESHELVQSWYGTGSGEHHGRQHFVTKLETVLEADAAQPRPILKIQERLAVKEVFKDFLELDRKVNKMTRRTCWFLTLVAVGLLGKFLHRRFYQMPVDDTEFSKVHKPDPGVG
ncbi:MAG: hypothetical protein Q9161_005412 [Pseudevernia consocians]